MCAIYGRRKLRTAPLSCADDGGIATYIDQDGQSFACETVDALRAAVRLVRKFSRERREPIWSEKVLHNMTLAVLEDVFNEGARAMMLDCDRSG